MATFETGSMSPTTSSAIETVRRAFLKIDSTSVLRVVDGLDLRGHARISAVVGVPLRNLQQKREVAIFAATAPIAALRALLELLAMEPLEKVVEALGAHADTPNFNQLSAAIDVVRASGSSVDDIIALLAFAVVEEFPAAPHCRLLLEERPEFQLPELPDVVVTASMLAPKATDPQVREQRRLRREQEKLRKRAPTSVRASRSVKVKAASAATRSASVVTAVPMMKGEGERRRITLTPSEAVRFDPEHVLAGSVVIVDVPFDSLDPLTPEVKSKERPALVVAANAEAVLVRPVYSNPSPSRSVFQPWRRLGLDHLSYVDDTKVALMVPAPELLPRLGRLDDQEWNALL